MKIFSKLKVIKKKSNNIRKQSKQYLLKQANKNLDNLKIMYFEVEPAITRSLVDRIERVERKRHLSYSKDFENYLFSIYKNEGLYRCIEKFIISNATMDSESKTISLYKLSDKIKNVSLTDAIVVSRLSLSTFASEAIYEHLVELYFDNKEYYKSAYYLGFLDYYYGKNRHKIKGDRFVQKQIERFEKKQKLDLFERVKKRNEESYIEIESILGVAQAETIKNFKIDSFFFLNNYQKKGRILGLYNTHGVEGVKGYFLDKSNFFYATNISDYLLLSAEFIIPLSRNDSEVLVESSFDKAFTEKQFISILKFCVDNMFFSQAAKFIQSILTSIDIHDRRFKNLKKYIDNSPLYALSIIKELKKSKGLYTDFLPIKDRICYVLHNSLPYASGGYATRAHGVANGLSGLGYEVFGINRPGYPFDINKKFRTEDLDLEVKVDNVTYLHTPEPRRRNLYRYDYMHNSIKVYEEYFKELKPEVVIAASAYISSFPALIAAKKLGIPFVYEVRGFWEVTLMSRNPDYAKSDKFYMMKTLETVVADSADIVWTLTNAMRVELKERGLPKSRISVIPNSCFPEKFIPQARDKELADSLRIPEDIPVIGYIGTFVDYEGLENLTKACGLLKTRGIEFRLMLVGSENTSSRDKGPIRSLIETYAEQYDISDWLILPGRVPHEQVEKYYSLIDIAPFPRKPWPVCEMVSPMKPLEALAMKKAVVVSSVDALQEMVIDGQTGLVFDKNSTDDLADQLQRLITDSNLRVQLGSNGREWVEENRSWAVTMTKAKNVLNDLLN